MHRSNIDTINLLLLQIEMLAINHFVLKALAEAKSDNADTLSSLGEYFIYNHLKLSLCLLSFQYRIKPKGLESVC